MKVLTNSTYTEDGLDIDAAHALLGSPNGVRAAYIFSDPDCYPSQANPASGANTANNLVLSGGFGPLYAGSGLNNITNAPDFEGGAFKYTKANGDRLIASSAADFEIGNNVCLLTTWFRVASTYQEALLIDKGNLTPAGTAYSMVVTPNNVNFFWTFQGDSAFTALAPSSGSWILPDNSLHQIGLAFVPNGANSTMFLIRNGGVAAQQTYTGKNTIQSSAVPMSFGNVNAGSAADGKLYGVAFENCTISGNDPLKRALLEYQQMSEFFASL
jgi:hypothetical protein